MKENYLYHRISFWDNVKGTLIFLVVFGHFLMPYLIHSIPELLFDIIYIFHMPFFVFVSGFFSKKVSNARASIIKLFVTFLLFNYSMMFYAKIFDNMDFNLLQPYYSYWYLLALIFWRLIIPLIPKTKLALFVSILIMFVAGFWSEINNIFALARIIGFFPFFLAGFMFPAEKISSYLKTRKLVHSILGMVLLLFSIIVSIIVSKSGISINDLIWLPFISIRGLIYRLLIAYLSSVFIVSFILTVPTKPIPLISKWGKNSLSIFVLHRYFPFIFAKIFPQGNYHALYPFLIILSSLLITAILGMDKINIWLNNCLNTLTKPISLSYKKKKIELSVIYLLLLLIIVFPQLYNIISKSKMNPEIVRQTNKIDIIHPILSSEQQEKIDNAVSIAFVGDLILLQDQVREAWNNETKNYDFKPVFEYAKKYIQKADFAIGVLEGPLAGADAGYSTSNYNDGIPLHLNFPDSFADAILEAGIDMVTLANNHLLDKGVEGMNRTLEILRQKKLSNVGAYHDIEEKNKINFINIKNLKIAVLAYTIPSNYYEESYFFIENPSITSVLVDKNSPYFEIALEQVQNDFINAAKENPDFIIVIPHMGTQFIHTTDTFQNLWNDIFISLGADIILGDHSHAVQPIDFKKNLRQGNERNSVIVNCPGNFVNSYTKYNGDATSVVTIYVDSNNKNVFCSGVVPMWTHSFINKQHRALPIYDILTDENLFSHFSIYEIERIKQIQNLVTSVMISTPLSLDQHQDMYYFFSDGYYRQPSKPLVIDEKIKNTSFLKLLMNKQVCFVGDSITEGSKNGGYGWFEPLVEAIDDINVSVAGWAGATTHTLLENVEIISCNAADIYVIAIGTNDIRYRNELTCAMTAKDYIFNLQKITSYLLSQNPLAQFAFISPWPTMLNDPFTIASQDELDNLFREYDLYLSKFCQEEKYFYINPTEDILKVLNYEITSDYLLDHIHPNASKGIQLYSSSVLLNAK